MDYYLKRLKSLILFIPCIIAALIYLFVLGGLPIIYGSILIQLIFTLFLAYSIYISIKREYFEILEKTYFKIISDLFFNNIYIKVLDDLNNNIINSNSDEFDEVSIRDYYRGQNCLKINGFDYLYKYQLNYASELYKLFPCEYNILKNSINDFNKSQLKDI